MAMNVGGKIIVISGPSGVGKTTLYKRLLSDFSDNLAFVVSATTRAPRDGERDGLDYYYLTRQEFEAKIARNEFLEWEQVYANLYGTPKSEIERITSKGKNCLLDIDVKGGVHVKSIYPESHLIFIAPPSAEDLKIRIDGRKTETPETKKVRLENSLVEMEYSKKYDYTIINDDRDAAYIKLKELIRKILNG